MRRGLLIATIYQVAPPDTDPAFLFFSGDPVSHRYVALWAGVAVPSEERVVRRWVSKNAPGIPKPLAPVLRVARHASQVAALKPWIPGSLCTRTFGSRAARQRGPAITSGPR